MWLKTFEDRLCPSCEVPIEHWVLYGQSGRVVGEATFCPVCCPDVKGLLRKPPAVPRKRRWNHVGRSICLTPHDVLEE